MLIGSRCLAIPQTSKRVKSHAVRLYNACLGFGAKHKLRVKRLLLFIALLIQIHCFAQQTQDSTFVQKSDSVYTDYLLIDTTETKIYGELEMSASLLDSAAYSRSAYIKTVDKNTSVQILGYLDGFFKVRIPSTNETGYISYVFFVLSDDLRNFKLRHEEKVTVKSSYSIPAGSVGGSVYVKGHYRKDGTYVKPHTRSRPKRR
jgi:hypothetical protein